MHGPQGDYTGLFLLQLILLNSCSRALALLLTLNSVEVTLTEGRLTQHLNFCQISRTQTKITTYGFLDTCLDKNQFNSPWIQFNSIQFYLYSAFYNTGLSQSSFTKGPGLRPPQSKPRARKPRILFTSSSQNRSYPPFI